MCFMIVLSKAFKEPFASCRTTRLATHCCPQNCVNLNIFYLEFCFFCFFCSCQLALRLYYDRAEPQPVRAFRSKGPSFSDTAVLLLKSRTWWSETRSPLYEGSTDSEKIKIKKCPFTIAKKKKEIKIKWNSFFSSADFDPSEKQQLKSRAGANFQGMRCCWQPDSVMCNYENTWGINGRIYWPAAQ